MSIQDLIQQNKENDVKFYANLDQVKKLTEENNSLIDLKIKNENEILQELIKTDGKKILSDVNLFEYATLFYQQIPAFSSALKYHGISIVYDYDLHANAVLFCLDQEKNVLKSTVPVLQHILQIGQVIKFENKNKINTFIKKTKGQKIGVYAEGFVLQKEFFSLKQALDFIYH